MTFSEQSFEEVFAQVAAERKRRWDALQGRPWAELWREALVIKNIGWSAWRNRLMGACVYLQWGPDKIEEIETVLAADYLSEDQFNAAMAILDGEVRPREYFQCLLQLYQMDLQI